MIHLGMSFTDAYFETMSGLTTTGATVLSNLDTLPMSINLWRHQLVWVGGMGLIVLAIAILPLLGIGGRQMFKAETPGPMKDAKMTPRIAETAKGLWLVYFIVTIACVLAYHWAGMTWFDAVCHTFSTMGLGGFSTHDASFGFFNSPEIEFVSIVFMLIAGMNFGTLFLAVHGRSLRPYLLRSRGWLVHRGLPGEHRGGGSLYLGMGCLSRVRHRAALFGVQRGVDRDDDRLRQHRLCAVADLRAALDALPVEFRDQRRLDRRRHQDDACAAALQAGLSRTGARDAPERRVQHPHRRPGGAAADPVRGAGVRASCTWSASSR